jgi:alpha-tubulin suppressor-like RCC1 family protein
LKDGTVRCWGRNKGGQVGAGDADHQPAPIQVPRLVGVKQIATGATFSCALLADGKVSCWGTGRLAGDGKFRENAPPTAVAGVSGAKALTAGGYLMCAVVGNGKVKCWGLEGHKGQQTPEVADAVDVRPASAHACALAKSGKGRCWGEGLFIAGGVPVSDAQQLVTGDSFACALTRDKKVKCWGSNDEGQLGVAPDMDLHKAPVEVTGLGAVARVIAGQTQACAILEDGSVRCWGSNTQGELAAGKLSTDERPTVARGLAGIADVCVASMHACAKTEGGAVYCWGGNVAGQVGDGSEARRLTPTAVSF